MNPLQGGFVSASLGKKSLFVLHNLMALGSLLLQSSLISLSISFFGDVSSEALSPALVKVKVSVSGAVHLPPRYPGQVGGSGCFYHSCGDGREEFPLGILDIIGSGGQSV